jgi:hypothetical protein
MLDSRTISGKLTTRLVTGSRAASIRIRAVARARGGRRQISHRNMMVDNLISKTPVGLGRVRRVSR